MAKSCIFIAFLYETSNTLWVCLIHEPLEEYFVCLELQDQVFLLSICLFFI